jgi:hypothetical protein
MSHIIDTVGALEAQEDRCRENPRWTDEALSREGKKLGNIMHHDMPGGVVDAMLSRIFQLRAKGNPSYGPDLALLHRYVGIDLGMCLGMRGEALEAFTAEVLAEERWMRVVK